MSEIINTEFVFGRLLDLEREFDALLRHLGLEVHERKGERTGLVDTPWVKYTVVVPADKR